MIRFVTGDILGAQTEAVVNTVNCVGVMGRGIALQFKNAYPDNFKAYASACEAGDVRPGHMFVFDTRRLTPPRYIVNFPTKRHWKGKSRIEDIESGLVALVAELQGRRIRSIAVPPLGAGLGGLDWQAVRQRIVDALEPLHDVEVIVFEPDTAATPHATHTSVAPTMTPGRAALIALMRRYVRGVLDPSITLLEIHKLLYFLQVSGEPLRLKYRRAHYGPFAENLTHLLRAIDGHFVTGYQDGGDAPDKELTLVDDAYGHASAFLQSHEQTRLRIERVAALVEGFESPFGLELLATAHMILAAEPDLAGPALREAFYAWSDRKRAFNPTQIDLARRHLVEHGWLPR